jgi:hypothetical protein
MDPDFQIGPIRQTQDGVGRSAGMNENASKEG